MLIAFFLGFIAGVALQVQQTALWEAAWYLVCGLFGLAGLVRYGLRPKSVVGLLQKSVRLCLLLMCAAALSFGLTGYRSVMFIQTAMNPALEGADIDVVGVVTAMPQRLETGLRFRLDVESAHVVDKPVRLPPRLLLAWYRRSLNDDAATASAASAPSAAPAASVASVFASALDLEYAAQLPKAGERWQLTVRLKAPHGNSNPHGFDYELWAWEQGVQATGYVRENKRQAVPRRLGEASSNPFSSAAYGMERARQSTRDAVFKRLGNPDDRSAAGVVAALITGDQNAIERADWDIYRATGTAHLMSISGLHITMFAWMAALVIGWLWRTSARAQTLWIQRLCLHVPAAHAALLGGVLLAALYAWFSGWGIPAQRTVWMLATLSLLRFIGLRWPWYATWLLAAVVVLVVDPWAMLSAGFWLSFVAVAVLFASDKPADKDFVKLSLSGWRKIALKAWSLLREQWVITLALAPLTLLLFQQVSVVGLLANAVAIPVVTLLVTPLAMLGALSTVFAPLWDLASVALGYLSYVLKWLAALPYAVYAAPAPPLLLSSMAVLGGVLIILPLAFKKRLQAIALAIVLIAPALLWQPTRPASGQFELLAIDIGQGNAVLIRTANHSLLFDAGPRFSKESDAGHRTIVPLLRALGERLEVLMLSHRDSDHTGGAKAVLDAQPQARVMTSALTPKDHMDIGFPADQPLEPCVAGQYWQWDGVRFEVLHPTHEKLAAMAKSIERGEKPPRPNSLSCVLKITNADAAHPKSALLAADIEASEEQSLLSLPLNSTVLLVPHHGSKTSSTDAFIDAVKPQIAIVQAGYRNRFAHPRPEVMARYHVRGIQSVLSTSCGALTWRSDLPSLVTCQRDVAKRYWMHHTPIAMPE